MKIEVIPSASRLINSLRDIGYSFNDAVADIIDNSIEALSTVISINIVFNGKDSYLTICDNGNGLKGIEIQEAMRFGSNRNYSSNEDLGRFGLGLKTASLSQCERLTVSSRIGDERIRINSYCWDLEHISNTNKWEIIKIDKENLKEEILLHFKNTTGTAITWERLDRLLEYKYPNGESAKKQLELMTEDLKNHLGMIFHRFLSGEIYNKRIAIYINEVRVPPWDPFSRGEKDTDVLDEIRLPIDHSNGIAIVKVQPYILPNQSSYSSTKAHSTASGPQKWNKQQGLYIYRSNRIIQSGGWNALRTSDEHTKLLRIAVFIPQQIEEFFQVNVSKKHVILPSQLRSHLSNYLKIIISKAQEKYRDRLISENQKNLIDHKTSKVDKINEMEVNNLIETLIKFTKLETSQSDISNFFNDLILNSNSAEKSILINIIKKTALQKINANGNSH
jgi:hypothetical protein